MAVHLSCDMCGSGIDKSANNSVFEFGNIKVRTQVAVDDVWNGGHICVSCVMNTVLNGSVEEPEPAYHPVYRNPLRVPDVDSAYLNVNPDAGYVDDDEQSGNYGPNGI